MNRRKVIGVVGALLLAALGTAALIAYVSNAEERATAGEELVEVYIVSDQIAAGTAADRVENNVAVELVPVKARPEDSVTELGELTGLVAAVDLVPGEQLLRTRFIEKQTFDREVDRLTEIPPGLQEITLALEPERAAGGLALPGDTVGIFASFEPFQMSSEIPVEIDGNVVPPNGTTPNTTHLILHKVLVTNIQLEQLPQVEEQETLNGDGSERVKLAPSGKLLVTLALETDAAERVVFAQEFGTVWLSNEPLAAREEPSSIMTRGSVYDELLEILVRG